MFIRLFAVMVACAITMVGADLDGTWKLVSSKSKRRDESASSILKVQKTGPDTYHFIVDVVTKAGKKQHGEYDRTFDGKQHPIGTDGTTEIGAHPDPSTWTFTDYRDGKVIGEGKAVLSSNGKTHTVTRKGTATDGTTYDEFSYYQRE